MTSSPYAAKRSAGGCHFMLTYLRMKILFVTPGMTNRGGHIILTELYRRLSKKGHEVDVLLCRDQEGVPEEVAVTWRNIEPISVIGETRHPEKQFATFDRLAEKLAEIDGAYDHIILDSWRTVHAAILNGITKPHYFQLVQSDPEFTPESPDVFWKAELHKLLPRFPLKRIHVSKIFSDLFAKRYGTLGEPYIELGIRDAFHQTQHQPRATEKIKLITVSGNIAIPTKGLGDLTEIINQLDPNKFELTIISPKPVEIKTQMKVNQIGLSDPKDLANTLAAQDIFISTSKKETFGLAQAEAMTIGLPTVAFDAIGNRSYMTEDNCVLVENVEEAVREVQLLESFDRRVRLSSEARESMGRWNLDRMVEQFLDVVGG